MCISLSPFLCSFEQMRCTCSKKVLIKACKYILVQANLSTTSPTKSNQTSYNGDTRENSMSITWVYTESNHLNSPRIPTASKNSRLLIKSGIQTDDNEGLRDDGILSIFLIWVGNHSKTRCLEIFALFKKNLT